jgi:hypothetical protein
MDKPFQINKPQGEQQTPYVPPGPPDPLLFDQFQGVNTSTTRAGVDDKMAYWLDGFMPIGPRFLRTLYDVGTAIHTETNTQIAFFNFGNIGSTPYCIVIHTDGSIHAVNTDTLAETQIAAAGTIQSPSRQAVGISQWGSQYIIIVSQQTNGYFLWNGTIFTTAGGLSPVVTISNGGTGYTSAPAVSVTGGAGSGATFQATVSGGAVTAIKVLTPGTGYLATDTLTAHFTGGGGSAAAATVSLMPFGISGTSLEIYAGRVWVSNNATITFSAPGSFIDFATGDGGGNFTSSDSFLRVSFTQLIQTNGFLYLIADSSINYISGVQTSGTPPTTTFTNQNADPEVGTPWAGTVDVFGRNIVFANAFGAHISYGAAVTKISEPLDGVYNTVPNFANFVPSAAKSIIFGKKVWILLLPIIDPISGQQVNKLLMWDGKKWWASEQSIAIIYIQHQEINSVLTAYGTDGTSIYPLFNTPSALFTKRAQSKLWTKSQLELLQTTTRLWGAAQYYSADSPDLTVQIDNESGASSANASLAPAVVTWHTQTGAVMNWTTQTGAAMVWRVAGIAIIAPTAVSQNGVMLGMTASTASADMALIMLAIDVKLTQFRG